MARRTGPFWPTVLAIAGAVVVLDQATKAWVLKHLAGGPPVVVIPGFFNLLYGRNTGGVFGLLSGAPSLPRRLFFVGATVLALVLIAHFLRRWGRESRLLTVALSLVAGGAVGNLIDRLRFGSVIDFIDWYWRSHHWYTFNVADSAISVGAVLLLVQAMLPERPAHAADPSQPLPGSQD